MKICSSCRIEKPFDAFYKAKTKPSGYAYQCKTCSDISNTKSRLNHPEKTKEHRKRSRDKFFGERQKYKLNTGCVCCGEMEVACLELHHIDPLVKDIHPSKATSRQIFYKEANKCVVVCANCHRKLHAKILNLPL